MVKFALLSKRSSMKKFFIGLLTGVISISAALAQKGGPVIFTVAKDTVYGAEFERVFSKNSKPGKGAPAMEELEEYLQLYIKFKLKVKEAYALGMDTNQAFIQELAGYRKQLAVPYLTDKEVTDQLMQEAYDRMKTEVRASHIMVRLSPDASPKDTLEAWKKINEWRNKITKEGMAFDSVAYQYSEDESARFNFGDLGYFSSFAMIYAFENMAFTTPVGQVSAPFRTQFGYHILTVKDKRPTRGDVRCAHIMIRFNNESEVDASKVRIDGIYKKLTSGEEFSTLVQQFSEDFTTKSRNGELNWFNSTANNIPAVFRETAFSLKNVGDYSEPVKSDFGWHIVKLIEKKPLAPYDELRESIKYKVQKDQRSEKNKEVVLIRIKKENNFTEMPKALVQYIALADSGITKTDWTPNDKLTKLNTTALFNIGGKNYTYQDFNSFIKANASNKTAAGKEGVVRTYYNDFVNKSNMDYEDAMLETKFPDFNFLMQEYRDGILLFELTDKMVWSKSVEDTTGLNKFFNANRDKYMWGERAELQQYTCKDEKTAAKTRKLVAKGTLPTEVLSKLNAKDPNAVKLTEKLIEKGDKAFTQIQWQTGIQEMPSVDQTVTFIHISKIKTPERKALHETLGVATTDYQTQLENEWIASLQQKYPVIVNPNGLEQIFK
jgi:peptidyl-prolyl cis-trans isomerase SurA